MADLMDTLGRLVGTRPRADDRGQLVLVAGLTLAVILVAFVLLANTAIYTENLATRDNGVGEHDALGYRSSVVAGVGGIVERENAAEYDSYGAVEGNVSAGIGALDEQLRGSAARTAASARINESGATYTAGTLIRQTNSSREFRSNTSAANWTVTGQTLSVRAFVMNVTPLESANVGSLSGAFTVEVVDVSDGDVWRVYVYENATTGDVAVAVEPIGGSPTQVCSVAGTSATLDLTGGTLAGDACPGLDWAEGVTDERTVRFENGDRARGTYDLTAEGGPGLLSITNLNDDPATGSPYYVDAVYAVELSIRYQTAELEYATTIRVAPGEHDA